MDKHIQNIKNTFQNIMESIGLGVIGVVSRRLEAVALEKFHRRRLQTTFHLRRVEYIKVEEEGVVCVEKHVSQKRNLLHCFSLKPI